MMDFTIVIPHRGSGLGLWATLHSIQEELRDTEFLYNFVIVTNGAKLIAEERVTLDNLSRSGKLKQHIHVDESVAPPVARRMGVEASDGELLFFFDNHCLVRRGYFLRAVFDFKQKGVDILHSSTIFQQQAGTTYHYIMRLEKDFWGSCNGVAQDSVRPYEIACGGHGGFAVRRSVWDDIGGYGPDSLFAGYGGEEAIFDLKAWRYGYKVHIDPKVIHYHYPGARQYGRHFTDEYYTNLLVSANVIGGEKWMYKVFSNFITPGQHMRSNPAGTWFDLLMRAHERSAQYAVEVDRRSKYTLDELLTQFRVNQIAM